MLSFYHSCRFSGHHLQGTLIFILAHSSLICPPHLMQVLGPSSRGWIVSFACIWHITASGLALTSHVVNFVLHKSHMTLLTSIQEPHQFACLCCTNSCAFATIYPVHVLVCLRATCFIHIAWMTFGPLSTIPTWGTAYATIIG